MDPNAALVRLRELMTLLDTIDNKEDRLSAIAEVYDTFTGLDTWLSRGGFLPIAWQHD